MSKPKKDRRVQYPPSTVYFKPQGIPLFQLAQETLTVDEYEALRLVDREGLDQQQAAQRMDVSRATCARILNSAHRKVAEALTEGKAIRIEGGSFVLRVNRFRCLDCGVLWEAEVDGVASPPVDAPSCPKCGSARVLDLARQAGWRPGGSCGPGKGFGRRGAHGGGAGRRRRWHPAGEGGDTGQ